MLMRRLSKSRFNPATGIADFWKEFRKPQDHRWAILLASVLPVIGILYWATQQSVTGPPPRPEVTWISTFAPDRTDEEIIASNIANQERKDALAAERARREEEKKQMYRDLGRATGIDVDEMERRIEEERAAEAGAASQAESEAPVGE